MDNCPYMYFERDGNASITMCSLHPNEIWGIDERTCMHCPNSDPKWREWKLSLEENYGKENKHDMIKEECHSLNEVSCDDPVTRVIIGGDEVMTVNPDSDWEIDRILTDYKVGYDHKELIVVFKRKEADHDV